MAGCTVKSWSTRQATPAMSSVEVEYFAMVKASAEAFGIRGRLGLGGAYSLVRGQQCGCHFFGIHNTQFFL